MVELCFYCQREVATHLGACKDCHESNRGIDDQRLCERKHKVPFRQRKDKKGWYCPYCMRIEHAPTR